jgi:hypothetical protein
VDSKLGFVELITNISIQKYNKIRFTKVSLWIYFIKFKISKYILIAYIYEE